VIGNPGIIEEITKIKRDPSKGWHPTKNGKLKPQEFLPGSDEKIYWKCKKVPSHIWKASIYNRSKLHGTGCPYCAGRKMKNISA